MEFFNVYVSEESKRQVLECLESGWISEGKKVKLFEEMLQGLGLNHPIAVNSGTAALHIALEVAGVGVGDEVIIPSQTFVATGLAVLMTGAKPVFADINLSSGNILPESVENLITEQTRAIIPVHWGGYPCEMDELSEIADKQSIFILEDAAHALGALYKGKPIGSLSRFTAFSFQAIKHCTSGDGGAVCCYSIEDAKTTKTLRWFGIDREKSEPSVLGERRFDISRVGFKYHMNDISASIGIGNLITFPERLEIRRSIGKLYRSRLSEVPGLKLLNCRNEDEHAFWLFSMLVENRDGFIRMMRERGIPVSVVHQGIHKYSVFNGYRMELENQRVFDKKHIALPIHSNLLAEDIDIVIDTILSGW